MVTDPHLRYPPRAWLWPIVLLYLLAVGSFLLVYTIDHVDAGGSLNWHAAWNRFLSLSADHLGDAISQLAPVLVAMLGIVVTVVAIIVQLVAARYNGVTRMFLRDPINRLVLGYYVVAGVYGIWLSVSLQADFVPRTTLLLGLFGASLGVLLMLPYFAYVFWFLEPTRLVSRIGRSASRAIRRAAGKQAPARLDELQRSVLGALAELYDIASHSISAKDKIIASCAVDACKDLLCDYLELKSRLPSDWFSIGPGIAGNPDFVAMDPESLADLESRRSWLEWQVLRQYLGIHSDALAQMPDIGYLIAIDTRYVAMAAVDADEGEIVDLCLRYLNSFLRASLNARKVRSAYNLLNQYRLLVEGLLKRRKSVAALAGVRHMSYYGHVGYDLDLSFVTATVAFDLSALCQVAHEQDAPEQDQILAHFLDLDRPLRGEQQEQALLAVRKAQAKLAAYYLSASDERRATAIARDMKDEPVERLQQIETELTKVRSKDFWEIIDRGRNFEYLPEPHRSQLPRFFSAVASARSAAP